MDDVFRASITPYKPDKKQNEIKRFLFLFLFCFFFLLNTELLLPFRFSRRRVHGALWYTVERSDGKLNVIVVHYRHPYKTRVTYELLISYFIMSSPAIMHRFMTTLYPARIRQYLPS